MANGTEALQGLLGRLASFPAKAWKFLTELPAALLAAIVLIPLGTWVVAFRDGPEVYKIVVLSSAPEGKEKPDYSQKFWGGFLKEVQAPEEKQAITLPFTFRGV